MTRRALVLVDLDQFFADRNGSDGIPSTTTAKTLIARLLPPPYWPLLDIEEVVVALAFNTTGARRVAKFGIAFLTGLVDLFGRIAASTRARLRAEFSVNLTMPETADSALVALCQSAPDAEHAGNFDHVVLFSRDRSLREAIAEIARTPLTPFGNAEMCRGGASWQARGTFLRQAPVARQTRTDILQTPPAFTPTAFIDNPALTAWASCQSLGTRGVLNLDSLASKIETDPSLLTQIGVTWPTERGCTRGVGRLTRQLTTSGEPGTLGACGPEDGLEVSLAEPPSGATWNYRSASPIGPGAIRLAAKPKEDTIYLTVRTLLPNWVYSSDVAVILDGPARQSNDFENLKHCLFSERTIHTRCDFVRVRQDSTRASFCQLQQTAGGIVPTTWWWIPESGGQKQVVTVKFALPQIRLGDGRSSAKVELRATIRNVPCVAIRSPAGGIGYACDVVADSIVCPKGLTAGAICLGLCKHPSHELAVFSLFEQDPKGMAKVRSIQEVSWEDMRACSAGACRRMTKRDWAELQLLPLLVATEAVQAKAGMPTMRSGGRT